MLRGWEADIVIAMNDSGNAAPPQTATIDDLIAAAPLETIDLELAGRSWRITAVLDQDALLDIATRFETIPYGLLLWESAVGLAEALAGAPGSIARRRVMELGAGVGLAGLVARHLGADVVQTDHEPVALSVALRNAKSNGVSGIRQMIADWRSWDHAALYDVIVGADIVYDQSVHDHLAHIFERNLAPGGLLLLADPDRPRTLGFLAKLEDRGWRFTIEVVTVRAVPGGRGRTAVPVSIVRGRRQSGPSAST
jgi:predicted nicotinamide N-methyase